MPVVARTGGLADTVIDANAAAVAAGVATGFVFSPLTAGALLSAIARMREAHGKPETWRAMQRQGMKSRCLVVRKRRAIRRAFPQPLVAGLTVDAAGCKHRGRRTCASASNSASAQAMWLCLFDGDKETRIAMEKSGDEFTAFVPGIGGGARYGYRADGPFDPDRGLWFDPAKLLMDPYATRIDRPWQHDPRLALPREAGFDTAPLAPKAIVEMARPVERPPGHVPARRADL